MRFFTIGEVDPKCGYDLFGNLVLNSENVIDSAVEAFGPNVTAVAGVDELSCDTQPIAATIDDLSANTRASK